MNRGGSPRCWADFNRTRRQGTSSMTIAHTHSSPSTTGIATAASNRSRKQPWHHRQQHGQRPARSSAASSASSSSWCCPRYDDRTDRARMCDDADGLQPRGLGWDGDISPQSIDRSIDPTIHPSKTPNQHPPIQTIAPRRTLSLHHRSPAPGPCSGARREDTAAGRPCGGGRGGRAAAGRWTRTSRP